MANVQPLAARPILSHAQPVRKRRSTSRIASSRFQWRLANSMVIPEAMPSSIRRWREMTVLWLRRPKNCADLAQRRPGVLAGQPHGQHPRVADRFVLRPDCRPAGSTPKMSHTACSMSGSRTIRLLCRISSARASPAMASVIGRPVAWLVAWSRHSAPDSSRAWQVNCGGDELLHVLRQAQGKPPRHLPHNAQPRGIIGGFDQADHAALEPRRQLRPQFGQIGRRAIRGEHQLPALAQQFVDGVQQLDLRGALSDQEMQIVQQQQLHAAVLAAEIGKPAAAQRLQEPAGEMLRREVDGPQSRAAVYGRRGKCRGASASCPLRSDRGSTTA